VIRALSLAALAALGLWTFPAGAQTEETTLQSLKRGIETPAHRALMSVIDEAKGVPSEFVTDGCSGGLSSTWTVVADLFPDFREAQGSSPPWEACCVVHDLSYHNAGGATGADESFALRLLADEALRQCVIDEGAGRAAAIAVEYNVTEAQVGLAYQAIADAMFNAVRFGGGPCSGLPWRWGFGYPGCLFQLP
jgi:hypothetical protein